MSKERSRGAREISDTTDERHGGIQQNVVLGEVGRIG